MNGAKRFTATIELNVAAPATQPGLQEGVE